jgi:tripartite-type tricarboxylate transporter receptor subunit TctC
MSKFTTVGRIGAALVALATAAMSLPAQAQTYPSRPVRIIVPYGAGGIADVTMRMVAQKLQDRFGQSFVIDNRPGAAGIVGLKAAQAAGSDGYTITMIGGGFTIAKSLFKTLPYDLEKDFVPISTTASYGLVMATKTGSKLKTVKDVIEFAKANPNKLNFGAINPGSTQHLSAELFRIMAGIDVAMIPYKTTPDLATAVIRGDIDVAFDYFPGFQASLADNQMQAIATTAKERASNLPDTPTVIESGLMPEYDVTSWNGLAAPAGTPADIIQKLHDGVDAALKSPEIQAVSSKSGMEARSMTTDELRARIKRDVERWGGVIEKAGVPKQ